MLDLGQFAKIFFIDWDHVRNRTRTVNVTVQGTSEAITDRKWKDGEVVNTLRKFSDAERAPIDQA